MKSHRHKRRPRTTGMTMKFTRWSADDYFSQRLSHLFECIANSPRASTGSSRNHLFTVNSIIIIIIDYDVWNDSDDIV